MTKPITRLHEDTRARDRASKSCEETKGQPPPIKHAKALAKKGLA